MNESQQSAQTTRSAGSENDPAIACLVLGILALVLSFLIVGGLLGLVGMVLGAISLKLRRGGRKMAIWGLGLSVVGVMATAGMGFLYYRWYRMIEKEIRGEGTEESLTAWKGIRAPEIDATTLSGERIRLSELKGRRVVLDFWATWCPPCVKEIPDFIRLSKESPLDELMVIGISNEDAAKLQRFVAEKGISYPISSIEDEDLPSPYRDVSSIPTTFFIDRNGVIQEVLIGGHDLATLRTAALAKDFEGTPKDAPVKPPSGLKQAAKKLRSSRAWSREIPSAYALSWADLDGDGNQDVLALDSHRILHVIDMDGNPREEIQLPHGYGRLRCRLHPPRPLVIAASSGVAREVSLIGMDGKEFRFLPLDRANRNLEWLDVGNDGRDELLVLADDSEELRVISPEGDEIKRIPLREEINDISFARARAGRPARIVVLTEKENDLLIFDENGSCIKTLKAPVDYCTLEDAARPDQSDSLAIILERMQSEKLLCLDLDGKVLWEWRYGDDYPGSYIESSLGSDLEGDGRVEWVFKMDDNCFQVVSVKGEDLGKLGIEGSDEDFIRAMTVSRANGKSLLVTLCNNMLEAYSFEY